MTETRPYELLARFDKTGKIAGVSIRTITTIAGRDYESDPVPLSGATDAAFTAFASQFSATAIAERDAEKADHEATKKLKQEADAEASRLLQETWATSQAVLQQSESAAKALLQETEAERDRALSRVTELEAQVESMETQVATIAAQATEIERLTALVPPPIGPRQIYPRELLARLTFAEVVAAIRTDDDAAIYAVANLQTTVSPVDLDSEETRTLIGALAVAGILTPERLAEILA